ncbi:lysoplasmalogenase [Yinghuangia seranimata]|uniref:lysoplasmalogenase n=1 Tax=Yinghuangia seranimata TaxID=408067 RepID=UPI00248BA3B8|nr:lysoplasmalogenase [Yinghuangia seranimata]MDI2127436.1 lysoplasmalogenase [Yinghuangia seranimata]
MTPLAWTLLAVAAVLAVVDWVALARVDVGTALRLRSGAAGGGRVAGASEGAGGGASLAAYADTGHTDAGPGETGYAEAGYAPPPGYEEAVYVGPDDLARASRTDRRTRPAVTLALIAFAAVVQPASRAEQAAFLAALVLSLARDLISPDGNRWFPAAVTVSLGAHIAYIVGFQQVGWSWLWAAAGIVVVLVAALAYAVRLVLGARAAEPALTVPVVLYVGVLSVMVVAASATGQPTAVAGAFLYYCADAVAGWNRFREPTPYARATIAVAYHLARVLLVVSLL